jgi:hypothetical protein
MTKPLSSRHPPFLLLPFYRTSKANENEWVTKTKIDKKSAHRMGLRLLRSG